MRQKAIPEVLMPFLDGKLLLIDKPLQWTSFDIVNKIRYLIVKKTIINILKIVIPKLRRLYEQDKNIKILFHCYAGVSRSSTVAIAYLSKITNKTTREIYELVKEKRPRINPNTTFRKMIGLD